MFAIGIYGPKCVWTKSMNVHNDLKKMPSSVFAKELRMLSFRMSPLQSQKKKHYLLDWKTQKKTNSQSKEEGKNFL